MTTRTQDSQFAVAMEDCINKPDSPTMGSGALDYAKDWIGDNLSPEDVFPSDVLDDWAKRNGYTKE